MNKTINKILSIFLAVLTVFAVIPFIPDAEAYTYGDFEYADSGENTVVITGYNGNASVVNIPAELDGKSVTAIGENAFAGNGIKRVIIPSSVDVVSKGAFAGCPNLQEIAVDVDYYSEIVFEDFDDMNFINDTAIVSFSGVISSETDTLFRFNRYTFSFENNQYIYSPENMGGFDEIRVCGDYIYSAENGEANIIRFLNYDTETINIPEKIEGNTVVSIGEFAFSALTEIGVEGNQYNLRKITVPSSVKSIERYAFAEDCSLQEISMPVSLEYIGYHAFDGCVSLENVKLPENISAIPDGTFAGCRLNGIVIPENVKTVCKNSIGVNSGEIVLSDGIEYLGECAFDNYQFREITLPESVKVIDGTFKGQKELESVRLNENLNKIGKDSFKDCPNLKYVVFGKNISEVKSNAFADCSGLETVIIGDFVTDIAADAFADSENVTICCNSGSYAENFAKNNSVKVTTLIVEGIPKQTYTSKEIKPELVVRMSDKTLKLNKDYKSDFYNNINVGYAQVTVYGLGDLSMLMTTAEFVIMARDISETNIGNIDSVIYNGEACTPDFTIKFNGTELKENKDYKVTYENNNSVGTGTVRVKGIGNFRGTTEVQFEIREAKESLIHRIIAFIVKVFRTVINWIKNLFR